LAGTGEVTARVVRRAAEEFKHPVEHLTQATAPHKQGLPQEGWEFTFKLIEQAETGAKAQDMQVVLDALRNLRKCVTALQNR
jgi:hypothetical protein